MSPWGGCFSTRDGIHQLCQNPMKSIRIQKGYDLPISGEPSRDLVRPAPPERVASLPERIPFVKPRLTVKEGDTVKIGSVLFEDKRNPDVKFLSPGGGRIQQINFGKRRVIKEIIIELDGTEKQERFEIFGETDIDRRKRPDLVSAVMRGGCWGLFRALPFGDMPDRETEPPSIIVNMDSREPFQPSPEVFLHGHEDLFRYGVNLLKKLTKNVQYRCHRPTWFNPASEGYADPYGHGSLSCRRTRGSALPYQAGTRRKTMPGASPVKTCCLWPVC